MCVTSMIIDQGQKYYNYHYGIFNTDRPYINFINPELQVKFLQFVSSLKKMVADAEEYDKVTNQPDCVDPNKEQFMKKLEELEEAILNANRRT